MNAFWSPHVLEESVVLLDGGDLYLFDLDPCSDPLFSSPALIFWEKLEVLWAESFIYEKRRVVEV